MASQKDRRGSQSLGCVFLVAVFGPMIALGSLWALIGMTGGAGATGMSGPRDELMRFMVWILLLAGLLNIGGLVYAAYRRISHRHPEREWRR